MCELCDRALDLVRKECPNARIRRAAVTFETRQMWTIDCPEQEHTRLVAVVESALDAELVGFCAYWAANVGCEKFTIMVPAHLEVPVDTKALVSEEGGTIVAIDD